MEENNYTLEQMRSDYQALKDSLAKQEIINDKLLRSTMQGKVGSIRTNVAVSIACAIFVMLGAPVIFHYNPVVNASWWFVAATELLMGLCLYIDWKFNRKVQNADLSCCDLLTFSRDVRELKQNYRDWLKWGISLGLIWAAWLCVEVWFNSNEPKLAMAMIVGLAFGLVAGMLIGWRMQRKILRTCDEIVSSIEK